MHLEVVNPEAYLEQVVRAGADIVTVQVEATRFPFRVLYLLKELGVKAGLAYAAATPLGNLDPVLGALDVIHIMTAEPNGTAAHFIPGVLTKIRRAAEMVAGRPIEIEVDGGINQDNARLVVNAGATVLVAGRAIWGAPTTEEGVRALRSAATRRVSA